MALSNLTDVITELLTLKLRYIGIKKHKQHRQSLEEK